MQHVAHRKSDAHIELIEKVARRLWFETVDAEGYPNGMMTWDEMKAAAVAAMTAETPENQKSFILNTKRTLQLYVSMAEGAIEVIEHARASAPDKERS